MNLFLIKGENVWFRCKLCSSGWVYSLPSLGVESERGERYCETSRVGEARPPKISRR